MATQSDEYERRRFTRAEYNTMLDAGILLPQEKSILQDGFVMIPDIRDMGFGPNPNPGPFDATDPADQVLAERETVDRVAMEVTEIMNALNTGTQQRYAPRKFTVDEYYRMGEVGILSPDERTELLEGEIIVMAPIGSKHASCVKYFNRSFAPLSMNDATLVQVQDPVLLENRTEVQPDLAVVRLAPYADAHPRPEDVLLLVEVSDTTIGDDRRRKMPLYARLGIPEAWLADVNAQAVDIHTDPRDGVYTNVRTVEMDGTLTPTAFPDLVIPVRDIFQW